MMGKPGKIAAVLTACILTGCTDIPRPGDIMDGDGMIRDFFSYDLKGTWHEIWPGSSETLTFEKDSVLLQKDDGSESTLAYTLEDGSEMRESDHMIYLGLSGYEYSELVYQDMQTETGVKGYLFAVEAITGDEDPYQTVKIFQHEDDRNRYTADDLPRLQK